MFVINYPLDNTQPAFKVSAINIKICVSRICPGIIEESNDKLITLPVIEVEDLEEYKRRYTDVHTTWINLNVFKSFTDCLIIPTRVLKYINPLTKEKIYYPTKLDRWDKNLNEKELGKIASLQKQNNYSNHYGSYETIGAMDLET
jgi:hypothetical protein